MFITERGRGSCLSLGALVCQTRRDPLPESENRQESVGLPIFLSDYRDLIAAKAKPAAEIPAATSTAASTAS
jgi:hypothetical protein